MAYIVTYVPDASIEPLLGAHLASIAPSQTPRSLSARRSTILRIARRLGHPVADTTYPALLAWQLSQSHLKKASMAAALTHLTCYLAWVVKQKHRPDNPAEDLARPRHAYGKEPRPASDRDIARALEHADPIMHAWISLGAFCGLRCMEIAAVTRADILVGAPSRLSIHGKGGKDRTVRLPTDLCAALLSAPFPARGHLWRDEAAPFTAAKVSRRINDFLRGVGVDATAHMLRHRFGTELYRATRDVVAVKDAMGHESVETTMCYVRAVGDSRTDDAIELISHLAA